MKEYFAKYLPVEGEIKENDWILLPDGDIVQYILTKIGHIPTNWKKVKLFLCSRDIQVGDKYISVMPGSIIETERYTSEPSPENYKVIGEISPEAIWVKEGDELVADDVQIIYAVPVRKTSRNNEAKHTLYFNTHPTEDEIEDRAMYWAEHIDGAGHSYGYEVFWGESPTYISHVKIKCPTCQTFH